MGVGGLVEEYLGMYEMSPPPGRRGMSSAPPDQPAKATARPDKQTAPQLQRNPEE